MRSNGVLGCAEALVAPFAEIDLIEILIVFAFFGYFYYFILFLFASLCPILKATVVEP